ncbi:MAG: T9SS type A sorting domain-containing protein [Patescibacteria group bacterium]|nr:T9SS type A sorting domain-containing protein [Patescibacteria group bacterium]
MKTTKLFFVLASVLIFIVLLPSLVFSQTTQSTADPQNDWVDTNSWVASIPRAPFYQQKVYLYNDARKHYPVLVFEQMDSSVTIDGATYSQYYYTRTNFNTPSSMPAYVEVEGCIENISTNPDIQIRLSVYFANSKTGEWSESGTQVISTDWKKYIFDFNRPSVMKKYNIFSITVGMYPANGRRVFSKVGLYQINYYDPSMNLTWNYNLITDVPRGTSTPTEFKLEQNYPNPFNPVTIIKFKVPSSQVVTLKIYDLLGREVATMVNEEKVPGSYEVKFDGSNLASGMYIYQLQAGNFVQVKKMMLIK